MYLYINICICTQVREKKGEGRSQIWEAQAITNIRIRTGVFNTVLEYTPPSPAPGKGNISQVLGEKNMKRENVREKERGQKKEEKIKR
jgi:hypothetical protein